MTNETAVSNVPVAETLNVEPREVTPIETVEAQPVREPEKVSKLGYGQLRARVRELEPLEQRTRELEAELAKYRTATPQPEQRSEPPAEVVESPKAPEQTPLSREQQEYLGAGVGSFQERVGKAKEKYSDMDIALDPRMGPAAHIAPGSEMDRWIIHSEMGPDLIHHFHTNRNDFARIAAMPIRNQAELIAFNREMIKLEGKLSGEEKAVPEIRVTRALPPAREVGGRGSTSVDEVTKAVNDNDAGAFIAAENRRMIAARRNRHQ